MNSKTRCAWCHVRVAPKQTKPLDDPLVDPLFVTVPEPDEVMEMDLMITQLVVLKLKALKSEDSLE
jgi:hypothetical protein